MDDLLTKAHRKIDELCQQKLFFGEYIVEFKNSIVIELTTKKTERVVTAKNGSIINHSNELRKRAHQRLDELSHQNKFYGKLITYFKQSLFQIEVRKTERLTKSMPGVP